MMLEYERIHANEVDTYIPKGMPKIQPEKPKKKFVRYDEGAELYSMSQKRFETFHLMRKR